MYLAENAKIWKGMGPEMVKYLANYKQLPGKTRSDEDNQKLAQLQIQDRRTTEDSLPDTAANKRGSGGSVEGPSGKRHKGKGKGKTGGAPKCDLGENGEETDMDALFEHVFPHPIAPETACDVSAKDTLDDKKAESSGSSPSPEVEEEPPADAQAASEAGEEEDNEGDEGEEEEKEDHNGEEEEEEEEEEDGDKEDEEADAAETETKEVK